MSPPHSPYRGIVVTTHKIVITNYILKMPPTFSCISQDSNRCWRASADVGVHLFLYVHKNLIFRLYFLKRRWFCARAFLFIAIRFGILLNSLFFTKHDGFTTSNLIKLLNIKAQPLTNLLGGVSFHLGNLSSKLFKL